MELSDLLLDYWRHEIGNQIRSITPKGVLEWPNSRY